MNQALQTSSETTSAVYCSRLLWYAML